MHPLDRVVLSHGRQPDQPLPLALVNVTNRCNLHCAHCFVYRDGNPNEASSPRLELSDDAILETLEALRDRHGIGFMLWMGGEPMLRRRLLERGVSLFATNHIVTNGTVPLVDLGPDALYIVSLDGPEDVNDEVRGAGSFRRVMANLERLPEVFSTPVQVQCTVTTRNEGRLGELVEMLVDTRVSWMTFSFYVPSANDTSGLAWPTNAERMRAVEEVAALKSRFAWFVRNRRRALELMEPRNAKQVTDACLAKALLLPLYLEDDHFTTPFCCYGDDVDCERCGAWVVFDLASRVESGPPGILPTRRPGQRPA